MNVGLLLGKKDYILKFEICPFFESVCVYRIVTQLLFSP